MELIVTRLKPSSLRMSGVVAERTTRSIYVIMYTPTVIHRTVWRTRVGRDVPVNTGCMGKRGFIIASQGSLAAAGSGKLDLVEDERKWTQIENICVYRRRSAV